MSKTKPLPKPSTEPVKPWRQRVAKGTIGGALDMLVAFDLMQQGWHLFTRLTVSVPCNLVVMSPDGTTLHRVRVGRGYRRKNTISFRDKRKGWGGWDLLAVVMNDDSIRYQLAEGGDLVRAFSPSDAVRAGVRAYPHSENNRPAELPSEDRVKEGGPGETIRERNLGALREPLDKLRVTPQHDRRTQGDQHGA
ncbi:MAG: hypothetical protein IIA59_00535 [Candidatus Marinimicrobia bacterium]|nr:hypothetical protein [Candidatus Neomarinimicrobiota bacterium]